MKNTFSFILFFALMYCKLDFCYSQSNLIDLKLKGNIKSIDYSFDQISKNDTIIIEKKPYAITRYREILPKSIDFNYRGPFFQNVHRINSTFDKKGNQIEIALFDTNNIEQDKNTYLYTYDEKDNITSCYIYDFKGTVLERYSNSYNKDGMLINSKIYFKEDSLISNTSYTYNNKNQIIKKECQSKKYENKKYNEAGETSTLNSSQKNNIIYYRYDENNQLSWLKQTDYNGNVLSNILYIYTYDERKNILKKITYDSLTLNVRKNVYVYDEQNNCIKETYYKGNDSVLYTLVFLYIYDSTGRIIQKKFGSEGEIVETNYYCYNEQDKLVENTYVTGGTSCLNKDATKILIINSEVYLKFDSQGNWIECFQSVYASDIKNTGSGILIKRKIDYYKSLLSDKK